MSDPDKASGGKEDSGAPQVERRKGDRRTSTHDRRGGDRVVTEDNPRRKNPGRRKND